MLYTYMAAQRPGQSGQSGQSKNVEKTSPGQYIDCSAKASCGSRATDASKLPQSLRAEMPGHTYATHMSAAISRSLLHTCTPSMIVRRTQRSLCIEPSPAPAAAPTPTPAAPAAPPPSKAACSLALPPRRTGLLHLPICPRAIIPSAAAAAAISAAAGPGFSAAVPAAAVPAVADRPGPGVGLSRIGEQHTLV